jgi:hypothetical protein
MMKGKPWTPATLREVGGTQGVGLTFLEETFSASTAPPEHRFHQTAAQSVLISLLPESGTDIKGQMRSRQELLDASGYASRPEDFDDLVRILDPELRLITPTDPEGSSSEGQQKTPGGQYYVLAHDYLVHSLREWLNRKQRETRRGRAELRLSELASFWTAKPENRHLPTGLEWANIRLLTRKKDWTEPERKMMRKSGKRYLASAGLILFIGLVARLGVECNRYLHASALVQQLRHADTQIVGGIVSQLTTCRHWANPRLFRLLAESSPSSTEHLHASLALLSVDPSQIDYLFPRMLNVDGNELTVMIDFLRPYKEQLVPRLWPILDVTEPGTVSWNAESSPSPLSPSAGGQQAAAAPAAPDGRLDELGLFGSVSMPAKSSLILRVATILARYDPANQRWEKSKTRISNELVQLDPVQLAYWVTALRPVKDVLIGALLSINLDDKRPPTEKSIAAVVLRDYGVEANNLRLPVMIGD